MIKYKKLLSVVLVIMFFILTACQNKEVKLSEEKLIEEFIQTYYTIDYDEINRLNEITDEGELSQYEEIIRDKYKKYLTDDEYNRLLENRAFYNNQVNLMTFGVSSKILNVALDKNDLEYTCHITLKFTDKNGEENVKYFDGYIRINDLCIIEYVDLKLIK